MLLLLALHEISTERGEGLLPELVRLLERYRACSEPHGPPALYPDKLGLSASSHGDPLEEHWALLRRASHMAP
jgi:hypothetical protein